MKKTSPRNFGKQLTVALATLTAALFMTIPEVQAQASKTPKSSQARKETARVTSHDTPPPVLIMDGSFILEIKKRDFDETDIVSMQRKKYRHLPVMAGDKVYIAHIKVVDGSGEILFRGDYHRPSTDLGITVTTAANDVVNLASVGNNFEINTAANKKLEMSTGEDKPVGGLRQGRFRYRNDSGNADTRIKRVTVKKGATTVFETDLADLPGEGRELKVMIWLDEG